MKLLFVLALYREVPGWKILYILSKVCGVSVTNGTDLQLYVYYVTQCGLVRYIWQLYCLRIVHLNFDINALR